MLSILEADGPHVVQPAHREIYVSYMCYIQLYKCREVLNGFKIPGISIITSKYPEFVTVDSGPMSRSCHRQAEREPVQLQGPH